MGGVVSTPRGEAGAEEHGEHLLGVFVGERSQDLSSPFWHKLLSLPLSFHWPEETVKQACETLVQNNRNTAHLAKLLIHLAWSLQEIASASPGTHLTAVKVINATHFSRVFLQHFLRHVKGDGLGQAFILYLNDFDAEFIHLPKGKISVPSMVLPALLSFIGSSDINPNSYLLQLELVNLLVVMMSSQLYSVPSDGPSDAHPFLDAAMMQESTLVAPFVRKLFLSCIARLPIPSEAAYHANLLKGKQLGVFWKMSSAAATVLMLPYFTYSYLVTSNAEKFSKFPLADNSLLLLLVLTHYGKNRPVDTTLENAAELRDDDATVLDPPSYFSNPFRQALESARDTDFDLVDIVENGQGSSLVKIPFAALYDQIGMCLSDDSWILLLYSLVHGNPAFLEYVLVRTDLDTMLLPVLEMLYNAPRRSANQIYMLLIILLILSQDSSFNASIHKLLLPGVSWYKERLLPQISLGSLVVVILIRTVKYNLSRLRDVFLHTNCLAILANMAPHMHQLNAYASQRLVSLFDMLARKYARLTDMHAITNVSALKSGHVEGMDVPDDMPAELHIYTDFLRIVLEIINAILTYALPRNPEVIYALLHRQELFQPFRDHPRFYELLENIYTVLDFFNVRMDDQQHISEEWSVESVLQLIVTTARSWRGDGMKTFTQLRFTYEEELHPEEFFVPYVWQLVVSHSGIQWDTETISLFQARPNLEVADINDKLTVLTS